MISIYLSRQAQSYCDYVEFDNEDFEDAQAAYDWMISFDGDYLATVENDAEPCADDYYVYVSNHVPMEHHGWKELVIDKAKVIDALERMVAK